MKYYRYRFRWCGHSFILTSIQDDIERAKLAALGWIAATIDEGEIEFIGETKNYDAPTLEYQS